MREVLRKVFPWVGDTKKEKTIAPKEAFGQHIDTALRVQDLKKQRRQLIMDGNVNKEEIRRITTEIEALEEKKDELRDLALPRKVS